MNYLDKLNKFNSTPKYQTELDLIYGEIKDAAGRVLDYGCGTGYAVEYFRSLWVDVFGYDAKRHDLDFNYAPATGRWDSVYFMHSIAHIHGIKEVLKTLKTHRVIVLTPNQDWIDKNKKPDYTPDPTVIEHYTPQQLTDLFIECGYKVDKCIADERIFLTARKK